MDYLVVKSNWGGTFHVKHLQMHSSAATFSASRLLGAFLCPHVHVFTAAADTLAQAWEFSPHGNLHFLVFSWELRAGRGHTRKKSAARCRPLLLPPALWQQRFPAD